MITDDIPVTFRQRDLDQIPLCQQKKDKTIPLGKLVVRKGYFPAAQEKRSTNKKTAQTKCLQHGHAAKSAKQINAPDKCRIHTKSKKEPIHEQPPIFTPLSWSML